MLQVSSHVTPLEYSSLTPWTSVYAIYPIYSPETYDIWKNDPSIHLPENVISWISWKNNDQKKTKLYPENTDVTINETTKSKQNEKFNSVIESGLNLSGQIRDNSWPRRNVSIIRLNVNFN